MSFKNIYTKPGDYDAMEYRGRTPMDRRLCLWGTGLDNRVGPPGGGEFVE